MPALQLGLLVMGAGVVAGVVVYNRLQERSVRRQAERAFGSQHADVLAGSAPAARQEPTLETSHGRGPGIQDDALPDSRVDYVINLQVPGGVSGATLLEEWGALEHRFAKRVMLAGTDGDGWRRIAAGDAGSFTSLQAALQMVSRDGAVPDAEVLEFRSQVETLGAKFAATPAAPEMRQALEAARELDGVCAEADIQVGLHIVGIVLPQDFGIEGHPFRVTPRDDGVTLSLDVAHTAEPGRAFEAMARAAVHLAAAHAGRIVDDNGQVLDERSLATIAAQVDAVRHALVEQGIEPGSPLARRLFS